ncbi:MAG: SGNH/GDSL hydrolase family protein [Phycisphaerae bacterium]|nr:SGNH/GDSL hydrolase family protein [Phycisphaerae bacterium]
MKTRYICLFLAVTAMLIIGEGCSKQQEPVTIVCIGDSLTTCGGEGGRYTDWLVKFLPADTIINKGIGGDTLEGGRKRFEKDVLELRPDIVVIELGANDFWQKKRHIEELQADLEDMVHQASKAGIKVVIASCFGGRDYKREKNVEFGSDRYDLGTAIAQMEKDVCKRYDCEYVPNMQIDIKPNMTFPYWDDTNHPNKAGNEFVAKRILEGVKRAKKALR